MGLMKAMRGVATGYLGARVDMMAADAKKKREDEIRAAEEAHDLNKLNDKYKLERALQMDLLETKLGHQTKKDLEAEKERLEKMRKQKSAEGYTKPMLDILELQGYLDSDAAFNTWFNRYDSKLPDMDWHLESYIDSETKEQMTFQEGYIKQWEQYIGKQGSAQGEGSVFSTANVVDSLKNQNNISDNAAKVVASSDEEIESSTSGETKEPVVESSIYKEGQIPGPIEGVDLTRDLDTSTEVSETKTSGSRHWMLDMLPDSPKKEIRLYTNDDPNWDNFTNAPKNLNEGSELLLLTLDDKSGQYVAKVVTYADDFETINKKVGENEQKIVNAIYDNKFLMNVNEDLGALMGQGPEAVKNYFAKNAENQRLFANLFDYGMDLSQAYESLEIPVGPQTLMQHAINLHNQTRFETARSTKVIFDDPNKDNLYKFNTLLNDIKNVYASVRSATGNFDTNNVNHKNEITRLQEFSLNRLRQNFAFQFIPDEKVGTWQGKQSEEYKEAIRLFDRIIADIKLPEGKGNKGAFWITDKNMKEGFEKIREETKFQAPFIGVDESIPVPGGGDEGGDEITGTIPSSIEDGVTTYDLSALPKDEDDIQQIKNVDFAKTQRYNLDNKATEQTGYTYILKDGSQINVMPGDIINVRGRNKIVNLSTMGDEGNKQLLIQPYSGSVKENPNRVLLDSKIKQLNKVEKLSMPSGTPSNPMNEKAQEDWIKRKEERITTLKKEIEDLYNKILKG